MLPYYDQLEDLLTNIESKKFSQVQIAIALYSASAEDLETVDCFFDFHETNESPMNIQYPVIDLLVSGHVALNLLRRKFLFQVHSSSIEEP